MPSWRRWLALLLLPGLAGVIGTPARADHLPDSPLCTIGPAPAAGITDAVSSQPDPLGHPRLFRWTLTSTALSGIATVNVLVPPENVTSHEALYLLHGHGGSSDDWWKKPDSNSTSIEELAGDRLVVMPDGGYDGWYSDWYGVDIDGHNGTVAPGWETFHIDELVPFIDQTYHPTSQMIAGLSMGGYGAMIYAARHRELFTAVASFSGALDTQLFDPAEPEVQPLFQNTPDRKAPDMCIWGDGVLQHDIWTEHNPAKQAAGLGDIPVYASSGDGCAPSAHNPDLAAPATCAEAGLLDPAKAGSLFTEWGVRQQNTTFRAALLDARGDANSCFDFYAPGHHSWGYWLDELVKFLEWNDTHSCTSSISVPNDVLG